MSRPIRIEFAGALYHVTARGDRRETIYEDDTDREHFLDVLGDVVGRFAGRLEQVRDRRGNLMTYRYDDRGRVLAETKAARGQV